MVKINLSEDDIKVLLKHTNKLKKEKLLSLFEDNHDGNLVLDSLSKVSFSNLDIKKLSFPVYSKLALYRYSNNIPKVNIDNKIYISDVLIDTLPALVKEQRFLNKEIKSSEKESKYYLILAGIFLDKIKETKDKYTLHYYENFIESGFRGVDLRDIAHQVPHWIGVINKITKNNGGKNLLS